MEKNGWFDWLCYTFLVFLFFIAGLKLGKDYGEKNPKKETELLHMHHEFFNTGDRSVYYQFQCTANHDQRLLEDIKVINSRLDAIQNNKKTKEGSND